MPQAIDNIDQVHLVKLVHNATKHSHKLNEELLNLRQKLQDIQNSSYAEAFKNWFWYSAVQNHSKEDFPHILCVSQHLVSRNDLQILHQLLIKKMLDPFEKIFCKMSSSEQNQTIDATACILNHCWKQGWNGSEIHNFIENPTNLNLRQTLVLINGSLCQRSQKHPFSQVAPFTSQQISSETQSTTVSGNDNDYRPEAQSIDFYNDHIDGCSSSDHKPLQQWPHMFLHTILSWNPQMTELAWCLCDLITDVKNIEEDPISLCDHYNFFWFLASQSDVLLEKFRLVVQTRDWKTKPKKPMLKKFLEPFHQVYMNSNVDLRSLGHTPIQSDAYQSSQLSSFWNSKFLVNLANFSLQSIEVGKYINAWIYHNNRIDKLQFIDELQQNENLFINMLSAEELGSKSWSTLHHGSKKAKVNRVLDQLESKFKNSITTQVHKRARLDY